MQDTRQLMIKFISSDVWFAYYGNFDIDFL